MTIDEAIKYELSGNVIPPTKYIQTYREQLVEWLEELKHYKLGDCMNDCEHYDNCSDYIYSKGYNKAIDDVRKKLLENGFIFTEHALNIFDEIAEQLKSKTKL